MYQLTVNQYSELQANHKTITSRGLCGIKSKVSVFPNPVSSVDMSQCTVSYSKWASLTILSTQTMFSITIMMKTTAKYTASLNILLAHRDKF
jgi:hypothetical protein